MSATTAWSGSGLRSTASGGLSGHAEHGRVDEQIRLPQVRRQMRPRRRLGRAAKMRSQRLGSTLRSVDDRDALKPARLERVYDRPGGAAGADDDGQFRSPRPAGRAVVHVGQKAADVGVVAPQKPVLPPQRVHRPERLGDPRSPVANSEGCFLVRRRHVSADELAPADPDRELAEFSRPDSKSLVASRKAELLQPVTVNRRRSGVVHRPARHPRAGRMSLDHSEIRLSRRSQARSLSIGNPRTTECSPSMRSMRWAPRPST